MNDPRNYADQERVLKVLCGKTMEEVYKKYDKFCQEHNVIDVKPSTGNFLFVFYLVPKEDFKKIKRGDVNHEMVTK